MKPAQAAKSYGLKTLSQGARFHGIHPDTLSDWYTERPNLFKAACELAATCLHGGIDYRELLIKYIKLVADHHGITYIESSDKRHPFTGQEWKILQNIANISSE